jgi:hypothetical protein
LAASALRQASWTKTYLPIETLKLEAGLNHGAMTVSIMTLITPPFSIMTQNVTIFSIMSFSTNETQHNDIQYNNIQNNDIKQNYTQHNNIQHNVIQHK